ncbi:MAG TPA: hypothetical protein VIB39_01545 [Candidatus Angelobacter sp.]
MTKSTGSTHRRIPINAWQRKPDSKEAVLRRMQTITRELEALQADMHIELAAPARGKANSFFADSTAVESLNLFKAELDQLRRILWFYIEEAARKPRATTDQEQQSRRLERVTDLLRVISPPSGNPEHGEQSGSFFERLNCVIDTYMQEKKPVSGETKPATRPNLKAFS